MLASRSGGQVSPHVTCYIKILLPFIFVQSLVKEPFKVRRELLQSSFNEIDGVSLAELNHLVWSCDDT